MTSITLKNKPYTYLLKHCYSGKVYYGVRYSKNCNPSDLWTVYFSSSLEVKKLIAEYGKDSFLYEIRKVFDNKEDAISWENTVLRRMGVVDNDMWLNKSASLAPPIRDISGDNNPMKSDIQRKRMREHNPSYRADVKKKISDANVGKIGTFTGRQHSNTTRNKMKSAWVDRKNKGWVYIPTDDAKKKISKALKGRVFSDEHKAKISASKKGMHIGKNNPAAKTIMYDGKIYGSIKDAADANSLSVYMIKKKMIIL